MADIPIGTEFTNWTVLSKAGTKKDKYIYWTCQCKCGTIKEVKGRDLRNGRSKSCGCLTKKAVSEAAKNRVIDEKGNTYGFLKVLERAGSDIHQQAQWKCQCENCGSIIIVRGADLRNGHTSSCGCIRSKGEYVISKILTENNIPFEKEKIFETCINQKTNHHYRFDFYVNNEYLIEYDGCQHFGELTNGWNNSENFEKTIERDKDKNQWCKENNIPLIRIPYTIQNKITIEDLIIKTSKYLI